MTMDISNQNKLSEFYEELKRLNVEIIRPDINECFADFKNLMVKNFTMLWVESKLLDTKLYQIL